MDWTFSLTDLLKWYVKTDHLENIYEIAWKLESAISV